jgi:hypothetical protein
VHSHPFLPSFQVEGSALNSRGSPLGSSFGASLEIFLCSSFCPSMSPEMPNSGRNLFGNGPWNFHGISLGDFEGTSLGTSLSGVEGTSLGVR